MRKEGGRSREGQNIRTGKEKSVASSICAHGMGLSLDAPAICMGRKRGLSFRGLDLAYSARKAFLDALRENDSVVKLYNSASIAEDHRA